MPVSYTHLDAGIETNDELSKFYTDYCSTRPSVGMAQQDWTLPEPNVSLCLLYTSEWSCWMITARCTMSCFWTWR